MGVGALNLDGVLVEGTEWKYAVTFLQPPSSISLCVPHNLTDCEPGVEVEGNETLPLQVEREPIRLSGKGDVYGDCAPGEETFDQGMVRIVARVCHGNNQITT